MTECVQVDLSTFCGEARLAAWVEEHIKVGNRRDGGCQPAERVQGIGLDQADIACLEQDLAPYKVDQTAPFLDVEQQVVKQTPRWRKPVGPDDDIREAYIRDQGSGKHSGCLLRWWQTSCSAGSFPHILPCSGET